MKIFIINGHPNPEGLASELSRQYAKGAQEGGHEVRLVNLSDLQFDPILRHGYRKIMPLEPDLVRQQENIRWCEHLVVATPIWWMGFPALLKGFIDRTILPGFAFSYGKSKLVPKGLMKGKNVRVIYTQGAPRCATAMIFLDFHWWLMKFAIFKFSGFSAVRRSVFGNADK